MKLLLSFGKKDFEVASAKFVGEAKDVASQVSALLARGKFMHEVCNDQEVFKVAEEDLPLYQSLAVKVKDWFDCYESDKDKYIFARHVKFWQ